MNNNPTDTNQASEDELRQAVRAEIKYRVEQEYEKYHNDTTFEYNGLDFWREQIENKLSNTLLSIIRTEKLKLLAEVREQQIPVIALKAKKPHDEVQIQAVPIESLTQLEAEL